MSEPVAYACPVCGFDVPENEMIEGCCPDCHEDRQRALNEHNATFDAWERMTPAERERRIKDAIR